MPAVIVETRPPRPSPEHVWVQGTGAGMTSAMAGAGTPACGFITDAMEVGTRVVPTGFQSRPPGFPLDHDFGRHGDPLTPVSPEPI